MIGYLEYFNEQPTRSQILGWGNPWAVQLEFVNGM